MPKYRIGPGASGRETRPRSRPKGRELEAADLGVAPTTPENTGTIPGDAIWMIEDVSRLISRAAAWICLPLGIGTTVCLPVIA